MCRILHEIPIVAVTGAGVAGRGCNKNANPHGSQRPRSDTR